MPFQRPISPISFEQCSVAASDLDPDDLLGSDEELDDAALAAKHRRIEEIAESYLRGRPLFILSASLRGPFDDSWKNPWAKRRKIAGDLPSRGVRPDAHMRQTEPVVQETDPGLPKYREDLAASRPSVDAALTGTSHPKPSFVIGCAQKRPFQDVAEGQQNRAPHFSAKKSRESTSTSTAAGDVTFARSGTNQWLRKDRKPTDFGRFEPPSSPTPKIAPRPADSAFRIRTSVPRSGGTETFKPPALQEASKSHPPEKVDMDATTLVLPQSVQTAIPTTYQLPTAASSPKNDQMSPRRTGNEATSFRVASSSSQLPRFEYRRWHQDSNLQIESNYPDKEPVEPQPAETVNKQDDDIIIQDAPEPIDEPMNDISAQEVNQSIHRSKDLRFADAERSESTATYPQATTEHNTYENLPSAQEVPPLPGVSDRMPSLHSTAMLRTDTEHIEDISPDTQLSTQAALLHAQKSFQDDLESPEQSLGKLPAQLRPQSPSGDDSVLLAQETPFYRPSIADKSLLRSSRQVVKDRMQAMSTQCMIDAATPYTFSTEKKAQAYRPISPQNQSIQEVEISRNEPRPREMSPSANNIVETAQSIAGQSSPREAERQPEQAPANPSTTQGTALPFDLSGDTPATAQDGQGGLEGGDSFPLSQAIADLGGWLGQSFEFLKEIQPASEQSRRGRSSQNTRTSAWRS